MKRFIATILFAGLLISTLYAGPFGLEFGWTIDEMIAGGVQFIYPTAEELKESEKDPFDYYSYDIIPPIPSELFPFYSVQIDNDLGLFSIEAYNGRPIVYEKDPNLRGHADNYAISEYDAENIFDRTYNALLLKYGEDSLYGNPFASDNAKDWWEEDNPEHLDIRLRAYESETRTSLGSNDGKDNGLYYVSLTYDKEDYLQALKDSEIF